jgi:regulatory protein
VRFRRRGAPTEGEPKTPAEAAEKAFGYALRLLGYRARSEWEVRDRLRRREYEEAVIDQVVERLCAVGLIDDAVFVEDYVRSHTAARPIGRTRLRWELKRKGVEEETIERALSRALSGAAERALALDLLERERDRCGATTPSEWARIRRLLIRRGFPFEMVNELVSHLWARR